MRALRLDAGRAPEELRAGLREIMAEYAARFSREADSLSITFESASKKVPGGFSVTVGDREARVLYARKVDAFRALGRLLGAGESLRKGQEFAETAQFDTLGVMVDISRNGVLRPDAARMLLRRCALMGINVFMLYAEDTYEVPGEPFFGYLRGRYTHDEMKGLDDYAHDLGIEMFPCIQTLGHLGQVLQWPAYAAYRDTKDVLLAEEEQTYRLIDKMIAAARAPFRSGRIHIGMDEAMGIGSGEYRKRHGDKKAFDILNSHLARVMKICEKQRLRPMIWSDMYFRIGSESGDYYDSNWKIPARVVKEIPPEVNLVYWDYYHTDSGFYSRWIDHHRALGSEPIMAGGLWTWNHFWAALPFAFTVTDACMTACKEKGLREVFVTLWGDDGMECDIFSSLPALQHFAEHGYADVSEPQRVRENFRGSCNADFDDWLKASELDSVPSIAHPSECNESVSKWLLWQDTLLGWMEPRIAHLSLRQHYGALSERLFASSGKDAASQRLRFPAHLARVLSHKCEFRRKLVAAYSSGDKAAVRRIASRDLPLLREAVDALWKCHREMWLATYKPSGLEVLEQRYGGLRTRLESLSDRLEQYLEGKVPSIPELETRLETVFDAPLGHIENLHHARIMTPSIIK